jgi:hypothetical protein
MPKYWTPVSSRSTAFQLQRGRCCYCRAPMWRLDPSELQPTLRLPSRAYRLLKCTAEHLEPRKDGGTNAARNVAAACWWCNTLRHRRKKELSPDAYRTHVSRRVARGRWWPPAIAAALRAEVCQSHG